MKTYPNQKVIHINKNKYSANFLQIGINEWQQAYKELKPSTFAIYLYLASNADGFDLALSQQAIENSLRIKKTAYHTAIKELKERGYIQVIQGNVEAFFTTPVRKNELKTEEAIFRKNELKSSQMRKEEFAKTNLKVRKNDIEIDNINNIDIIDKEFLPTEEILDGFAIEPVKQESINQNNEAVEADKVITINCSDMRDSYYHLYKYLAKYQPALIAFVVNGIAFCRDNKERTDKAIEICNTYGYTIKFTNTAAAVAGV